jgi:DNA invertase Pin-like site-specific DNA recombinase
MAKPKPVQWQGPDVAARYLRISDDKAGDAHGVSNQRETTGKHVADKGYDVAPGRGPAFTGEAGALIDCEPGEWADNDLSASKGAPRPGYEALMAAAARGEFNVLVVFQTSRLLRNRVERARAIEMLSRCGVRIEAVKGMSLDLSTAQGRSMASIGMEFDSMESEQKGERTTQAQHASAGKGLHLGGPRPFGWSLGPDPERASSPDLAWRLANVKPAVDPGEAREVIRAAQAVLAGRSLASLARELNEAGWRVPARKRKGQDREPVFTTDNLRGILLRERNCGMATFGEERFPGAWPALSYVDEAGTEHVFTEALYRQVRALLSAPERVSTGQREWSEMGRPVKHLLTGIALCGKCRAPMAAGSRRLANGQLALYKCSSAEHLQRNRVAVDYVVAEWFISWVTGMTAEDKAMLLGEDTAPASEADLAEAAKLRGKMAKIKELAEEDVLTPAEAKSKLATLRPKLAAVERRMSVTGRGPVLGDLLTATDVRAVWESLPVDRRRAMLREGPPIVIIPGTRGRTMTKGGGPGTWTLQSVGVRIGAGGWVPGRPDGTYPWDTAEPEGQES